MTGLATRLGAEASEASRSVIRLLRFDPLWAEGLDLSVDGFLRSFFAPLLALPLYLITLQLVARAQGWAGLSLFGASVAHLFDAFAYPAVLALVARPTGIGAGYGGFVVLANWSALFCNLLQAGFALLLMGVLHQFRLFQFLYTLLSVAYIFSLWRAGRETFGRSPSGQNALGPVLMAVVLAVGVSAVAERVGDWLS